MSGTVTRSDIRSFGVTCPHCGVRYEVDCVREVSVRVDRLTGDVEAAKRRAEARIAQIMDDPVKVYRCPRCRRLGPGALRSILWMLAFCLGLSIAGVIGSVVFLELAWRRPDLRTLALALLSMAAVAAGGLLAVMILINPVNCESRLTGRPPGSRGVDLYGRKASRRRWP